MSAIGVCRGVNPLKNTCTASTDLQTNVSHQPFMMMTALQSAINVKQCNLASEVKLICYIQPFKGALLHGNQFSPLLKRVVHFCTIRNERHNNSYSSNPWCNCMYQRSIIATRYSNEAVCLEIAPPLQTYHQLLPAILPSMVIIFSYSDTLRGIPELHMMYASLHGGNITLQ